jgi:hypothetical protein
MKFLYKYPQRRYPYEDLVTESINRSRDVSEHEILDTDIFDEDRYWDVFVEVIRNLIPDYQVCLIYFPQYAKDEEAPDNIYIRITTYNRGPDPATLHVIPQLWFPNTWSWPAVKPALPLLYATVRGDTKCITAKHPTLGKTNLYCLPSPPPVAPTFNGQVGAEEEAVEPQLLFTENDTNYSRLWGGVNKTPFVKDAFHDYIIPSHRPAPCNKDDAGSSTASDGDGNEPPSSGQNDTPPPQTNFVNPDSRGTKSAAHYVFKDVPGYGGCAVVRLKLTPLTPSKDPSIEDEGLFDDAMESRRQEADEFYNSLVFGPISDDLKQIMRQALGGMLWTKQYYRFIQKEWIEGDPGQPPPPPGRKFIRNSVRQLIRNSAQPVTYDQLY